MSIKSIKILFLISATKINKSGLVPIICRITYQQHRKNFNTIAKDYYQDDSFCRNNEGNINLWSVFNLFTQANKSSYIDTFFERTLNAFEFNQGICKAISGNSDYHWFLS